MGGPGDDITARTGPRGYVEPTFGQRLLARLADALVLLPILVPLSLVASGRLRVALVLAVGAAYEIGMVARRGRTLGKSLFGTRIVDATYGDAPTPRQAGVRWLVMFGGGLAGLIDPAWASLGQVTFVVSAVPILIPPFHQGLHDHAAGTMVTAPSDPIIN